MYLSLLLNLCEVLQTAFFSIISHLQYIEIEDIFKGKFALQINIEISSFQYPCVGIIHKYHLNPNISNISLLDIFPTFKFVS